MSRVTVSAVAAGVAIVALVTAVQAQQMTVEEKFGGLSQADVEAMGYVIPAPVCVDASVLPPFVLTALGIPATAAMGIHAVNVSLFDNQVDPLEPEVVIFGPDGTLWGVEYEATADTADPRVFGQDMTLLEGGHEGMEFDHYALHVWFIENPAGQFADFNPAVTCGAQTVQPPSTGSAGLLAASQGSGPALWLVALGTLAAALSGARLLLRRHPRN